MHNFIINIIFVALQARLESQLSKHKEMLKKGILKKRDILEKDLRLQIHVRL